jgi:hypothetical protein
MGCVWRVSDEGHQAEIFDCATDMSVSLGKIGDGGVWLIANTCSRRQIGR